jgi:predicted acylesterase/phospholipase RssA
VITNRRIGLALGAGAAKGLAHLGVLRALAALDVPVDMISGCSIGSAIAAGWASGLGADELTALTSRIAGRAIRPTLPLRSFLSSKGIRDELVREAGERRFEDMQIPLSLVATDIFRRSEVTFTKGLLWPCILASMALPGVYPPVAANGSYLVDGAVLNPVPVKQCRELGAGVVIAVRLTGKRTSPREQLDVRPSFPTAVETISRTFEIMNNRISEMSHVQADVTIEVSIEGGGIRDFKHVERISAEGASAVGLAHDQLAAAMPSIRTGA